MKTLQDLLKDLMENEELRLEAKKALKSETLKITEEQYAAVVAFGKEHGYEFTEEDIHLHRAANRQLDDAELELVNGGGMDDYCKCNDRGKCSKDLGCYNDYRCSSTQMTGHGGKGTCALDYACGLTYNSCFVTNECKQLSQCKSNAY